ncbi:1-acyldihydroxyacetone-phosphate reductase [Fusarium subglutinans]|uniref:1-acyldihydroxyacetone-phosphate reductase n=1 Tax=Gibberella subglutinans TaxID=42677 RepID=A0A8H5PWV0_GIBSU|nr:1-acyldihydroxyacetone-phosphate reductase [Fusarium subglutinans]KAF5603937.1 1-acyldihydroxyacetone-phosphate reductase [Fusarium subglutinans]
MTASYAPPFALVTGCNSGIGEQLAIALAKNSYTVFATAKRIESLDSLARQHANLIALPLQLSDSTSLEGLRDSVNKYTQGRLDILINNAGMHYASPATDIDVSEVAKLFAVNVVAVMHMCQLFIPLLRKAPRPRIVQIGSVTRDVPVDLRPLSIEVIEVVTGYVRSNILRDGVHISEDSLYRPIKSTVESVKNGGNKNGMPADEYARVVVRQVLGKKYKREIWEGHRARILRFMVTFFPIWLVVLGHRLYGVKFDRWAHLQQAVGTTVSPAHALTDHSNGGVFPLQGLKTSLEMLGVLGKQENVVPHATPDKHGPLRDVHLGSHPVGGVLSKLIGSAISHQVSVSPSLISQNPAPDPTHHWAVIVGEYYHELGGDRDLKVIYNNGKTSDQTALGAWQKPFWIGKTTFNDEAIRQAVLSPVPISHSTRSSIHDHKMTTAQAVLQQKLTITPKTASLLMQAGYSDYSQLKYATPNGIVDQFTSKFGIPKTSASAYRRACRRLVFLGTQDDPEEQEKVCADWTNKALAARGIWRDDFDDLTGEQIAEMIMGTAK